MKDKFLYRLLEIVNKNSDVRQLIREGIDYKMIGDLTTKALEEKYLIYQNDLIRITEKGIDKINTDAKKFKRINKEEWITPDKKSQIKKIDKNDIFLPNKDELSF